MANNPTVYTFSWVTDPYDESIGTRHQDLINSLSGSKFQVLVSASTPLDNSLVRTTFSVIELPGPSITYGSITLPGSNANHVIQSIIGDINYIPVTLVMTLDELIDPNVITRAKSLVKTLTSRILKTSVDYVSTTEYSNTTSRYIEFRPRLESGSYIYRPITQLGELLTVCDLNQLKGYQVCSDDPLVYYALSELAKDDLRINPDDLKLVKGVMLIKVNEDLNEANRRINEFIRKLRLERYFTIPSDLDVKLNLIDSPLYLELAQMMNIPLIDQSNTLLIFRDDLNIDFMSPESWFQQSIERIKARDLPRYLIGSWWKTETSTTELKAKLHMGAIRALINVAHDNSVLNHFISSVKVLDDLWLDIPITSVDDLTRFNQYILSNDILTQWTTVVCTDLIDLAVKRYYVNTQTEYPTLVVPVNLETEILVVATDNRSELTIPTRGDDAYELAQAALTQQLRQFYQKCQHHIEPVLREEINQMDLTQLLKLVTVTDDQTGPTFCYSIDTLEALPSLTNPMTRNPFTETVISIIKLFDWGLRGLFPFAIFSGLMSVPVRHLFSPVPGNILIQHDVVEVVTEEGEMLPLFEMIKPDLALIERLWKAGWFLTPWGTSYLQKTNQLSSSWIIPIHEFLITAGDSIVTGERALMLLKSALTSR